MNHGMSHLNARWKAVEDKPPGLLLEYVDEFPICGQIGFVPEDRCREVAGERASGAEIVAGGVAVDQQRVGSKNLIGKFGLADKLIETHGEELCLRVERHCGLQSTR